MLRMRVTVHAAIPDTQALLSPRVFFNTVTALLRPLDQTRIAFFRVLGPVARPFIRSRSLRASTLLTLSIVVAFALTLLAPLALLALGPLVLGMPHLAADARYLVLRPGLHRERMFWLITIPLAALTFTAEAHWGFLSVALAALAAMVRVKRLSTGALLALVLALLGLYASIVSADATSTWTAHAHNAFALLAFLIWPRWVGRTRSNAMPLLPISLVLLGALFLMLGGAEWVGLNFMQLDMEEGLGTPLVSHLYSLAPEGLSFEMGVRLVLLFAFTQSVHYGVWLRAIPEEDRPQPTPRSFTRAWNAMREEGSLHVMIVFGILTLALLGWAACDLSAARTGYLRFALAHGFLEVAVLVYSGGALTPKARV